MLSLTEVALVFSGGAIGSGLRFGSMQLATTLGMRASLALGLINLFGCILAGVALRSFAQLGVGGLNSELTQTLLIGGVLGGFTTFSAVSLECAASVASAQRRRARIEAVASIVLAVPMVRLGMLLASIGR